MAATRACGVIVSTTDGDTVAGPLKIQAIKALGGSTQGTIKLSVSGSTIYQQLVAASATPQTDPNFIFVGGGQTLTINFTGTGTGATLYIYTV